MIKKCDEMSLWHNVAWSSVPQLRRVSFSLLISAKMQVVYNYKHDLRSGLKILKNKMIVPSLILTKMGDWLVAQGCQLIKAHLEDSQMTFYKMLYEENQGVDHISLCSSENDY